MPEVAQRGEAHVEAVLRVEEGVHLLQVGHDLELRDAVIVERHAVVHRGMDMQIHHAGHERRARGVDHCRSRRDSDRLLRADLPDAASLQHDDRILHRFRAGTVDQRARLDVGERPALGGNLHFQHVWRVLSALFRDKRRDGPSSRCSVMLSRYPAHSICPTGANG
jgi:hypothetical protein